ncbi:rhodanese-like domain-containing protein [Candidatus Thiodiazotropha sp. CDECU1]|uniref:rhodanese-like domain-containing protein n=1 Tax=Candidatus Thiodiazotropha sp. CDECU1 TaxID=3065865 RepID=UPI00292D1DDC|nr:rhodanese-like domain-containing protein [Candidatus Thiodiazotropha sp. CDECU1]
MKHIIAITGFVSLTLSSFAWSYDTDMAKGYAKLFAPVVEADAGKALHFVKPDAFAKDIREGKEVVAIDVRTPAETGVFTLSMPDSLIIPVHELFNQKNLDRIPTDKPVIIVCKSGARATAVGTALRHIGFDNVYILKGGFQALSTYYGTKQAYQKLEKG